MNRKYHVLAAALLTFACDADRNPTIADIEEGYDNLTAKNLAQAVNDVGSEDNIPPVVLSILKMITRVDNPRCENDQNHPGYICVYNITLINSAGIRLDPVKNIKARVWQGDDGWMVHEFEE